MRPVLALILSATLFISTLDAQTFAQSPDPARSVSAPRPPARPAPVQAAPAPVKPLFISQCEAQQCISGGGGAMWVFEGNRGEAVWHYGAVADLTIERLDDKSIVLHRSDPVGTYSTKFAPNHGVFTAGYTGAIKGTRIEGAVTWNATNSGTWYAEITDGVCDVGDRCPLEPHQLVELGENLLGAKLYTAAFLSFRSAAARGDYDGEAFSAIMLRDGLVPGINPAPAQAFRMIKDSALHDSVNGELALSHMYELGIGTPRDPEQAAAWKNKATLDAQGSKAEQARAQANQATGLAIGATVMGLLILGAMAAGSSDSDEDTGAQDRDHARREQHGRNVSACDNGNKEACNQVSRPAPERDPD
jgi:hypothetical protein